MQRCCQLQSQAIARELADNAWLRELAKTAVSDGLPPPEGETIATLTTDTITDRHLEALYAFFVRCLSHQASTAILIGEASPLTLHDDHEKHAPRSILAKLASVLSPALVKKEEDGDGEQAEVKKSKFSSMLHAAAKRLRDLSGEAEVCKTEGPEQRRALILTLVLNYARSCGAIAIHDIRWTEPTEQKQPDDDKKALGRSISKASASERQAQARELALNDIGFLFQAYTPECYYWEIVELGRKLALTSILALITPGTAGQVVVGLLLSFFMLLVNTHFRPYALAPVNRVNIMAQLNLTLFLLVALLLKVNLDDQAQAGFFSGIVAFLSLFPVVLPLLLKVYTQIIGSDAGQAASSITNSAGAAVAQL